MENVKILLSNFTQLIIKHVYQNAILELICLSYSVNHVHQYAKHVQVMQLIVHYVQMVCIYKTYHVYHHVQLDINQQKI